MDNLLPWSLPLKVIAPFTLKQATVAILICLETMLRIHCMQQWYSLGDETMEDAMYEIASMRQFAQLSVDKAIPYRTTIMNFRHLPKQHKLTGKWFKTFNQWLSDCGEMMTQDTLVDITVIEAPCPTKTKKNKRDLIKLKNLLYGNEEFISGDTGYQKSGKSCNIRIWNGWLPNDHVKSGDWKASPKKQNGHRHRILKRQHPSKNQTTVPHCQMPILFYQSSLQGTGKKTTVDWLCYPLWRICLKLTRCCDDSQDLPGIRK